MRDERVPAVVPEGKQGEHHQHRAAGIRIQAAVRLDPLQHVLFGLLDGGLADTLRGADQPADPRLDVGEQIAVFPGKLLLVQAAAAAIQIA